MKDAIEVDFKILSKKWKLRVLNKKDYGKKNGKDSLAVTKVHRRRIDLSPKGSDLETIIHELTHAYLYEMCLHSTHEISGDDLEEIFAEMMAKRGKELLKLADSLIAQINDEPLYPPCF